MNTRLAAIGLALVNAVCLLIGIAERDLTTVLTSVSGLGLCFILEHAGRE